MFIYCFSLTNITIPDSVVTIGSFAFNDCYNLAEITIPDSVRNIGDYAFNACSHLARVRLPEGIANIGYGVFLDCWELNNVIIPKSVINLDYGAFAHCSSLTAVYFEGSPPDFSWGNTFDYDNITAYYLPGTTGWGATFAGFPTALWTLPYPLILNTGFSLAMQTNQFGFTISWATNIPVVVEASTNLAGAVWMPVATNTLVDGTNYFSDPQWTNYPGRFYRLRSP
jgi:hypothetical protein